MFRHVYSCQHRKPDIGIKISKQSPDIRYLTLQMAVWFLQSNKLAAKEVKSILDHYCKVSGQLVNYHKYKVEFSKEVDNVVRKEITELRQIAPSDKCECPGCSIINKMRTRTDFEKVKHRNLTKTIGMESSYIACRWGRFDWIKLYRCSTIFNELVKNLQIYL